MDHHGEKFLKWVDSQQVGCVFAHGLASHADKARWSGATVLGTSLAKEEVAILNTYFAESCGKFEAVHALFPDINTPAEVIGLIQALCATPSWQCVEIKVDCPNAGQTLLVGLRWFLPDKKHVNFVLGFGKFDPMPKTRRAPYTALVLRTGPPGRAPKVAYAHGAAPKQDRRNTQQPPIPVHLADMPDLLKTEARVAAVWAATSKLKSCQLDGDPMASAAKAKITFCLPPEMREGLAPFLSEIAGM